MNYQVHDTIPALHPFVKCFWTLEDNDTIVHERQRVVPDGCMEMIFNYGDRYWQYFRDGSRILQPKSFVFGQISSFIEIEASGAVGIIAARFLPGGAGPFLDMPVTTLENRAVDIKEVFGEKGTALEHSVLNAGDNKQRQELIEGFLLSRLSEPKAIDTITKDCVEIIFRTRGQMDVGELTGQLNINRRNMERKFADGIGMSPKQLSRVIRLQSTLKMLGEKNYTSLTSLAYENGYYDQAHFIKDFKEFTGISPKSFFSGHLQLAGLFAAAE